MLNCCRSLDDVFGRVLRWWQPLVVATANVCKRSAYESLKAEHGVALFLGPVNPGPMLLPGICCIAQMLPTGSSKIDPVTLGLRLHFDSGGLVEFVFGALVVVSGTYSGRVG